MDKEIERRIAIIESQINGEKFGKKDYIFTAIIILLCLALVIGGAFL